MMNIEKMSPQYKGFSGMYSEEPKPKPLTKFPPKPMDIKRIAKRNPKKK